MSTKIKNRNCSLCAKEIEDRHFLKCSQCNEFYDLSCAGVSKPRFYNIIVGERRADWKCVTCKAKLPKPDRANIHHPKNPRKLILQKIASEMRQFMEEISCELQAMSDQIKAVSRETAKLSDRVSICADRSANLDSA